MESITIKSELFNKMINALSQRPWVEINGLMSELISFVNETKEVVAEDSEQAAEK